MLVDDRPTLAVLGGSFNPPHLGHALLPSYLLARGLAQRILVAPCWDHPLGKQLAAFELRMSWTRLALAHHEDDPRVEVDDIERELAERGGRPSYTIELLEEVARRCPSWRVRLAIGSDITASGETKRWHRWDLIEERFDPIVVPRVGWSSPGQAALPEVSSTAVRERLAWLREGGERAERAVPDLECMLPDAVLEAVLTWVRGGAPRVWVVGHGHVASHAVPWLHDRGFDVVQLGARELVSGSAELPADGRPPIGVWLLCRDADLAALDRALVAALPGGTPVLHGAGALVAREALPGLHAHGHPVGTLHPICSLRRERDNSRLASASFGVEGEGEARALAKRLIGERPMLDLEGMDAQQRIAYHAACALAANHLAVIEQAAAEIMEGLGLERESVDRALWDLMIGALENLRQLGIPDGITGPLVRGDRGTVERHLLGIRDEANRELYRELSERLGRLLAR